MADVDTLLKDDAIRGLAKRAVEARKEWADLHNDPDRHGDPDKLIRYHFAQNEMVIALSAFEAALKAKQNAA